MAIFRSFWQAGFEGADFITRAGHPLSMDNATAHDVRHAEDYRALKPFNMHTVRESVGWRLVDKSGGYDFTTVAKKMMSAKESGIQICWTICHYGFPPHLDFSQQSLSLASPTCVARWRRFCAPGMRSRRSTHPSTKSHSQPGALRKDCFLPPLQAWAKASGSSDNSFVPP